MLRGSSFSPYHFVTQDQESLRTLSRCVVYICMHKFSRFQLEDHHHSWEDAHGIFKEQVQSRDLMQYTTAKKPFCSLEYPYDDKVD